MVHNFINQLWLGFTSSSSSRCFKRERKVKYAFQSSLTLLIISLLVTENVNAASQPAISITTSTQPASGSSYTGHNGNLHTWGAGTDLLLEAITTSTGTYSQSLFADNIIVRRVDNDNVTGNRCALFAQRTSSVYTLASSLQCDPAAVMSGRIINRGWLDVFSNDQGTATNRAEGNIERIDFIFTNGIQASLVQATLQNSGHIVTEKSGNNPTVMAAITSLDINGDPATYAQLVKVWPYNSGQAIRYGKVGASLPFSFLKDGDGVTSGGAPQDGEPERFGSSSEQLGVAFVTLDDLNIGLGQTYYGFSYFSQDIYGTTSINPVLYNTFPTSTSGGSSVADADMYGGVAGYFTLGRSISGNVYNDADGSATNNAGDSNLADITVQLYSDTNNNGTLDSGELEISNIETDASGNYFFNVGADASYLVLVDSNDTDIPSGLSPSGSNPYAVVVVTSNITGIDFPFSNAPISDQGCIIPPDPKGWAATDNTAELLSFVPSIVSPQETTTIKLRFNGSNIIANGEGMAYRAKTNEVFLVVSNDLYKVDVTNDPDVTGTDNVTLVSTDNGWGEVQGMAIYTDPVSKAETFLMLKNTGDVLLNVNPDTGVINSTVNLSGDISVLDSLAVDPSTGMGYGADDRSASLFGSSSNADIFYIDLATGVTTFLVEVAQAIDAEGLSFADDGKLYIEEDNGSLSQRTIFQLDLATGNLTPAAHFETTTGDVEAIAFNPGACVFPPVNEDYGDAPDTYGEASHVISASTTVYLGTVPPDADTQSQNAANGGVNGTGDDSDGTDDEDGISTFPSLTDNDSSYALNVVVTNTSGSLAHLVGWIDFNGDNSFDGSEAATQPVNTGTSGSTVTLTWTTPSDITAGNVFARIRLTTDTSIATGTANTSLANGVATDGEVEDYALTIDIGGFAVKGRVYNDLDVDGVNDSGESGISGLPIVLLDTINNTCISTRTDADGNYSFSSVTAGSYQLYEASQETIPTPQNCGVANAKDPAGYRSTTDNVLAAFNVVAADVTDKDFGDVKLPVFTPDHSGTVLPGNVVFYTHTFTPKSNGNVNLAVTSTTPSTTGWSMALYQDSNCNGLLDGVEGNTVASSNLVTTANTKICLINKVYAPSNASGGETYTNVITAVFDFNGNSLAGNTTLKVTDHTKVAANDTLGTSRLELRKTVENITQSTPETATQNQAKPGDVLKYRIYYSNSGTGVITDLKINDVVPALTVINGSPICESPLPASLTNCTPLINGNDIDWVFPASDSLKAGSQGVVSYKVTIE